MERGSAVSIIESEEPDGSFNKLHLIISSDRDEVTLLLSKCLGAKRRTASGTAVTVAQAKVLAGELLAFVAMVENEQGVTE